MNFTLSHQLRVVALCVREQERRKEREWEQEKEERQSGPARKTCVQALATATVCACE